jgi:hypothetical protein
MLPKEISVTKLPPFTARVFKSISQSELPKYLNQPNLAEVLTFLLCDLQYRKYGEHHREDQGVSLYSKTELEYELIRFTGLRMRCGGLRVSVPRPRSGSPQPELSRFQYKTTSTN